MYLFLENDDNFERIRVSEMISTKYEGINENVLVFPANKFCNEIVKHFQC